MKIKSLLPASVTWLSRLKGRQTCNDKPEKLENEFDEEGEETEEITEASSNRSNETISLENSDDTDNPPSPPLESERADAAIRVVDTDHSQFSYPGTDKNHHGGYHTLPYFYPQTLTRDLYYYRLSQTLTSIPELHPVSSSGNQYSCYCYNCLRDPISESILDSLSSRRVNRNNLSSDNLLISTVSKPFNTSLSSVAARGPGGGIHTNTQEGTQHVVYRRNPQADTGSKRNSWILRRSQRNRKAMSIPEELSSDSLQRPTPPTANRPPPLPLRRGGMGVIGKSSDELLQRSPSSPVSGGSVADKSPPPHFNHALAVSSGHNQYQQQPYLSSPGQKGSSSGSGKKLQDFKQTFFATWSRGTSSKKRQPQIQHHTTSGSNLAHTGTQDYMMMPQDTCGGGGLASCYGSGTGLVNMGRSGTSSQSSSINRLNNSGFSNNRDSSSFYSDCERNSFCSSMSDEAISPADAKQHRAMFGHSSDGVSSFGGTISIPRGANGSGGAGGYNMTSSASIPMSAPQISLPCSMMAVCDYDAIKEDEISVKAGDSVQVLSVRKCMYYVFKEATGDNTLDAEGYIPARVVNPACAELSHSQDSLKSPLSSSPNPNILNSTSTSLPAQRSSWHSTTPRLLDQSAATMSRQSREREPRSPGGQSTGGRKSRSTAMLTKQLSGPEENGGSGAGGGNSLLNTFRRRHRSTSKSSTLSRRLIGSGSDVSSDAASSTVSNGKANWAPYFLCTPTDLCVQTGESACLTCKVTGWPPPRVTWIDPKGHVIDLETACKRSMTVSTTEDGFSSLLIPICRKEDCGLYTCLVSNPQGSCVHQVALLTTGRPSEPGRPEIRKKSRTSVEIEWKPPEYTGNQLITGYTIEISRRNSNMFSPCGTMVSEPMALIEDLTPGVSYQFRVSAHNQSGISLPSEASEFVTISATENNKKGRLLSEGLGKVSWSSKFDDHYTKIDEIGRCEHKKLKGRGSGMPVSVAAKVINKNLLSKVDLESEAAVLNSLSHPNIVTPLQAYHSSHGNQTILVLELCEHKKLKGRGSGMPVSVAAKVINKNLLSKVDLESEAAVLNSLSHPNIVTPLQAYHSSHGNQTILVLELLPAGRLLDFIITHYSISYTEGVACNFVENVVQALHYLHLNGIAHLDLKPENVMVSVTSSSNAVAKLIDFGDASLLITNNNNNNIPHCSTASILGSVEFCAPELIESSGKVPATAQTDMWSLGCLIYVLLTGLSPFFDETTEETCRHIIEVDYSFPTEHFQEVSESAIELIKQLLTKDPLHRISSSSCVSYPWFQDCFPVKAPVIDTDRLQSFVDRRVYWSTDVRPLKKEIVKQLENS